MKAKSHGEESTCTICFLEFEEPFTLALCGHTFCSVCLADAVVLNDLALPVCCPSQGCAHPMASRDIAALCSAEVFD